MAERIVVLARLRKQAKRIPLPGKPDGPCNQQCGHFRCHRNTALASSNCILAVNESALAVCSSCEIHGHAVIIRVC